MRRTLILTLACLAIMLPGTVSAHPAMVFKATAFNGIRFSYGSSLAASVAGSKTYIQDMDWKMPAIVFRFNGYLIPTVNQGNVPQITVYAANARLLTTNRVFHDDLSPDVRLLRSIVRTRPALTTLRYIPYLLPRMDAGELLIARPHYIRFRNGLGVAFVTAMGMPVFTITNKTPVYWMFRGLTSNGKSVVAINMPLRVSGLSNARPVQWKSYKGFPAYAAKLQARLNGLADTSFTPYLSNLDKLAASLNVNPAGY